jgi:hypothetical protein
VHCGHKKGMNALLSSRPLALVAGLLFSLAACDDSSQPAARDRTAAAVCARYNACGQVGPGKMYASAESCDIDQRAAWEKMWPAEECDGRIDPVQLDICLQSINAAECMNGLDVLNILVNKCPKSKVCAATPK